MRIRSWNCLSPSNALDWELTEDEQYAVSGKLNQMAADGYFESDPSDNYF